MKISFAKAVPLASAAALLTCTHTASAAVDCATLPNNTYVTGSSAVKPFMAALGKALAGSSTIVYKGQGSCTGVDAIINGTKMTGTASYWDATGVEQTCNLTVTGDVADIGVSDVFATTCPGFASLPNDVGDFFGPNQVMELVVPKASSQVAISAQAGYFVFGFGAMAGQVAPWTNDAMLFVRNESSGTQQMWAHALNVPANKWKGAQHTSGGALLTDLVAAADPEAAIGILAADVADANRDKIKALAYQHYHQDCAYLPDSTATAFDKINVRDGHYPVWGPLHLLAKIDNAKNPSKPDAATLIGYFTGKKTTPMGVSLLDLEIGAHTVPACAMKVQRTTELGDMKPFASTEPCGCYFDFKTNGSTNCTKCMNDGGCSGATPKCRFGYCEAK